LIKTAQKNAWSWAYDQLSHQGRMHAEIMEFPNQNFYDKKLHAFDFVNLRKDVLYGKKIENHKYEYAKQISEKRLIFIDTELEEEYNQKINSDEARHVLEIIKYYQEASAADNYRLQANDIGVICPYKAQIAKINELLDANEIDHKGISIDTVERYQGGARNVIIYSLCINRVRQLPRLMSLSEEGVDRKLNVALTRAKEQIILLGNRKILESQGLFKKLINYYSS